MSDSSIIVIDDDKNNSQQISEILRQEGYTVYSTTTKAESVAQVKKEPPGLIFVKSMLMDASGYEIIRDIRSTHPDIPFIMLTEIDKRYDDRYRTIYRIVDTVRIPVEREDLLEKTRTHIIDTSETLNETAPYDFDKHDVVVEKEPQPPQQPQYEQEQEEPPQFQGDAPLHHGDKGGMFELEEVAYQHDQDAEGFEQDTEIHDSMPGDDTASIEENPRLANVRQKRDRFDFEEEIKRQNKPYGEDITTIEPDEEEFLRSLKEKNARRKKVIVGIAATVFFIIVGVVYMFGVKGGHSKDKRPVLEQKANQTTIPPVVQATPEATPVVVAPPPTVNPTPEAVRQITPAPPRPQHITPEYIEPEEVKPATKDITAKAQKQPQHKQKLVKKPPRTVIEPVVKTAKAKEKTAVAKAPKEHKEVKTTKNIKPAKDAQKDGNLPKKEMKKTPEEAASPSQEAYTIQLGSFADPANAQRMRDSLKKEGYNAFVKEFPAQSGQDLPMHKVFVGRYNSKADALTTVNKLRRTKKMDLILRKM
ncbi:MAG: SPOR domain-containing protein [Nitrospirae bacterium]|nr:SPOR domain-containing protein [Nitrospirota bacterium]